MNGLAGISVIIPCYNSAATLSGTLQSVAGQTLLPAQVICVDDGSSDATLAILEAEKAAFPEGVLLIVQLPRNGGVAAARNAGIAAATQEYIAFLDSDDVWHRRKLELQYYWMKAHPEADFTGHGFVWVEGRSDADLFFSSLVDERFSVRNIGRRDIFVSSVFPTPSVMMKKSLPFRFPEDMKVAEDYEMWIRIVLAGYKTYFFNIDLLCLLKPPYGAGGLTGNLVMMDIHHDKFLKKFRNEKIISLFLYIGLRFFFKLKHYRRLAKVALRNRGIS